jgi:acid phosphatase
MVRRVAFVSSCVIADNFHAYSTLGERTPVRVRMSDPPASIPADWQMCNTAKSFHETVAGQSPTIDDGLWYKKVVENRHGKTADGLWYVGLHI